MKYFKNVNTLEELKKEYRKLAKKYHPDLNNHDTTDIMQEVNREYETLFNQLKNSDKTSKNAKNENVNTFINIINVLIKYNDITIDIVGSWLWVHGNTFPIKDQLKKLGFRWSKSKKMWYFSNSLSKKRKKGTMTYSQIVNKYGRETIKSDNTMKYIS